MMSSSSSSRVRRAPSFYTMFIRTFLGAETNINIDGRCVVVIRRSRSTIIIKMCSQMFGNKMRRLPADNGERRCCAILYEVAEPPKEKVSHAVPYDVRIKHSNLFRRYASSFVVGISTLEFISRWDRLVIPEIFGRRKNRFRKSSYYPPEVCLKTVDNGPASQAEKR